MPFSNLNQYDIDNILKIFDNSLKLKVLIREKSPFYKLDDYDLNFISSILFNLKSYIDNLSHSLKIDPTQHQINKFDLNLLLDGFIIFTSKTVSKKLLNLGISKNKLLMITSPLSIDDLKIVNPNIPQERLLIINKQIEKNWNNIDSVINSNDQLKFFFIDEKDDIANQLIMNKLIEYFKIINKDLVILNSNDIFLL
ncbi:MAG: DUF2100 domain-containing protein [Candidatus Helarchaeota archaeon]